MSRRTAIVAMTGALVSVWAQVAGAQDSLISGYGKAEELLRNRKPSGGSGSSPRSESSRSESWQSESRPPSEEPERLSERERRRQTEAQARREAEAARRAEEERIARNLLIIDGALESARNDNSATPDTKPVSYDTSTAARRRVDLTTALTGAAASNFSVDVRPMTATRILGDSMVRELVRNARLRERHDAVVGDKPLRIPLQDSPGEKAYPRPWYYREKEELVTKMGFAIEEASRKYGVDADLVRAVMWLETTHGYYDRAKPRPSSLRPMNINAEAWAGLGFTRADLETPRRNVEAGTLLLKRLWDRTDGPTVEKVATLYNNLAALGVNSYGKTVAYYYGAKPWKRER